MICFQHLAFCLLVSKMRLFLPNKKALPIFTEALVIRKALSIFSKTSGVSFGATSAADPHHEMDFACFLQPLADFQGGHMPIHQHRNVGANFFILAQPLLDAGELQFQTLNRLANRGAGYYYR